MAKLAKIHGLSKKARIRLEILEFARNHSVSSPAAEYNPRNLKSLGDRSRKPKSTRKPTWNLALVEGIREHSPYLGRTRLILFLREEGHGGNNPHLPQDTRSSQRTRENEERDGDKDIRTSRRPHAERKPRATR